MQRTIQTGLFLGLVLAASIAILFALNPSDAPDPLRGTIDRFESRKPQESERSSIEARVSIEPRQEGILVVDEGGKGLADAEIEFVRSADSRFLDSERMVAGVSDVQGVFVPDRSSHGRAAIVSKAGYVAVGIPKVDCEVGCRVTLVKGHDLEVEVRDRSGGAVAGLRFFVSAEAIPRRVVPGRLGRPGPSAAAIHCGVSDESGRLVIRDLAAGAYHFNILAPDYRYWVDPGEVVRRPRDVPGPPLVITLGTLRGMLLRFEGDKVLGYRSDILPRGNVQAAIFGRGPAYLARKEEKETGAGKNAICNLFAVSDESQEMVSRTRVFFEKSGERVFERKLLPFRGRESWETVRITPPADANSAGELSVVVRSMDGEKLPIEVRVVKAWNKETSKILLRGYVAQEIGEEPVALEPGEYGLYLDKTQPMLLADLGRPVFKVEPGKTTRAVLQLKAPFVKCRVRFGGNLDRRFSVLLKGEFAGLKTTLFQARDGAHVWVPVGVAHVRVMQNREFVGRQRLKVTKGQDIIIDPKT